MEVKLIESGQFNLTINWSGKDRTEYLQKRNYMHIQSESGVILYILLGLQTFQSSEKYNTCNDTTGTRKELTHEFVAT